MAGDDEAGRNFAAKYEPCARTVVPAIDRAGQAVAAISGRLLTMAWNYLKTEDSVAAAFNGGQIDTASGMARPPECQPTNAYASLPRVVDPGQTNDIPVLSQFWPQGYPDKLRAAAQVWATAAELIDDAQVNAANQALPVFIFCQGTAVRAFGDYAATVFTGHLSGGTAVTSGQPLMENISAACRLLANACNSFADAMERVRNTITNLAIGAGIATGVGIVLSIVTLGGRTRRPERWTAPSSPRPSPPISWQRSPVAPPLRPLRRPKRLLRWLRLNSTWMSRVPAPRPGCQE